MAKSYNVSFDILGNLDGSFLGALQGAARAMQNLGNFSRAMQERINKYSRMQTAAQGVLKNIDAYRALQRAAESVESDTKPKNPARTSAGICRGKTRGRHDQNNAAERADKFTRRGNTGSTAESSAGGGGV